MALSGYAAVNAVAGLDMNVDRFIAPADMNHLAIQGTRLDDRANTRFHRPVAARRPYDLGLAADDPNRKPPSDCLPLKS